MSIQSEHIERVYKVGQPLCAERVRRLPTVTVHTGQGGVRESRPNFGFKVPHAKLSQVAATVKLCEMKHAGCRFSHWLMLTARTGRVGSRKLRMCSERFSGRQAAAKCPP